MREHEHGADAGTLLPELLQLLPHLLVHRDDPRLPNLVVLGPPPDLAALEVHVVPAERQNAAEAAPRPPCQEDQRMQEWVDGRRDPQQPVNRRLLEQEAVGVLLRRNLVLLEGVPREE